MEVEMDVAGVHNHHHQHQQELSSQTLESMLQVCTKAEADKKPRPPEEALKCPRCDSGNTKFCYYNNYSLTQPRYFCKSCRRYWTKGGTLRNVPVGGGCRKNKRSSSATSSSNSSPCSAAPSKIRGPQDHYLIQQHPLSFISPNGSNSSNNPLLAGLPQLPYDSTCTDLSLAFARLQSQANGSMGYDHFDHHLGFLESATNPNRFHHNLLYNGDNNLGNGDMGNVGNLMGLNNVELPLNHHHPVFHNDHHQQQQEQELIGSVASTGVLTTPVKQEASNMMRSYDTGLWGFPLQMGAGGAEPSNMVHEVGGWNGIGSTNWHGLINSPLM